MAGFGKGATALFSRKTPGGVFTISDIRDMTGKAFFVDSTNGATTNSGTNPDDALATIDAGITKCTAGEGDVVFVAPGHAETVSGAAGIDFDIAGVKVIGLGRGTDRPTVTMSAVASTIHMDTANSWLENILIVISADVTKCIDVDKTDCTIKDVEIRGNSSTQFVTAIDVDGGAGNAADRTVIDGCIIDADAVGATDGVKLAEVSDQVVIKGCWMTGNYSVAPVHNPTGSVLTDLTVRDCVLKNDTTGQTSVELVSASTGFLIQNYYHNDLAQATGQDAGSCFSYESYHCDAVDVSGTISPVVT